MPDQRSNVTWMLRRRAELVDVVSLIQYLMNPTLHTDQFRVLRSIRFAIRALIKSTIPNISVRGLKLESTFAL
jgi:hypothetical protein